MKRVNYHISVTLSLCSDNAALQEPDGGMFLARNPDQELRLLDPSPQNRHGLLLLLQLAQPGPAIVSSIIAMRKVKKSICRDGAGVGLELERAYA